MTNQQAEALLGANALRRQRAAVRKDLKEGRIGLSLLIETHAPEIERMYVFNALMMQPRFNHRGLRELNKRAMRDGINLAVMCGSMTPRTRAWVAEQCLR